MFIVLKNKYIKICVVQKCGPGSGNRTSKRTLRSQIRPSQIPGAGNGLWLEEEASIGQVVGRYSGEEITEEEALRRVQVNLPFQKPSHPPSLILTVCMCVGWCRRIHYEDKQRSIPWCSRTTSLGRSCCQWWPKIRIHYKREIWKCTCCKCVPCNRYECRFLNV